jgi:hypothetical protein
LQNGRVKTFRKPAIDWREQIARLGAFALIAPEAGKPDSSAGSAEQASPARGIPEPSIPLKSRLANNPSELAVFRKSCNSNREHDVLNFAPESS